MSDSEKKPQISSSGDTKIITFMVLLTVTIIVFMFLFSSSQNKKLTTINSTLRPDESFTVTPDVSDTSRNQEISSSVSYKKNREELEKEYDILIESVREKLKDAKTVHQQDAISSYYTMEAMELMVKQNNLLIEQNEKIIELLTELKNK